MQCFTKLNRRGIFLFGWYSSRNHTGKFIIFTAPVYSLGLCFMTNFKSCKEGDSMKIGFIGAGKMGYTLGRHLKACVASMCEIVGYYSQNIESAKDAAKFTDTAYYDDLEKLVCACDVLFLTVPDGQIAVMADRLDRLSCSIDGKILCHTSGALSSQVFSGMHSRIFGYSIHPIYAVSSKTESYINFSDCFITIEGHEVYQEELFKLFRACGHDVKIISAKDKVKYHGAAVFSSNLVIGLYHMAVGLMSECGFTMEEAEKALKPLFKNNADKLFLSDCKTALTGPVERCDEGTVKKHIESLSGDEKIIYKLLSKELVEIAEAKNNRDYSELKDLLQ